MVNEIKQLTESVVSFSQNRNWAQFQNPKDLAIALALEANEVLEHFRFKTEFSVDEVAKELADVLNVLLLLSANLKIDLVGWFYKKLDENEKKYPIEKFYGKNMKYSEVKCGC